MDHTTQEAADLFDDTEHWPEPLFDLTRQTWTKGQELEALLDDPTADKLEELVQLYERRLSALRDWAYDVGRQEPNPRG